MRFFPFSFRRLRWKLTASYTLVTVATLVALELLLLCAGLLVLRGLADRLPERITEEMADEVAPQVRPYLAGGTPDVDGIHSWLMSADESGISSTQGVPGVTITINAVDIEQVDTQYLVLDTQARVLGDVHQPAPPAAPRPLDVTTVPGLDGVLSRALAGERDPERLYTLTSSGQLTIAVPIRDDQGTVRGALVFSSPFSPIPAILGSTAALIAASALVLLLLVGIIGTIFGLLTARGFARRLNRVRSAATAWGQGDFTRSIDDRSKDEIGQLGRQLDRMAGELEELIQTRQQLSAIDERNRLARDLHDSVKQQMFATSMNLAAAQTLWEYDPAASRQRIDAALALVHQSQQEMTTIIQTLRPVQLEDKGLQEALAEYVQRWQDQSGVAATCEARGDGAIPLAVEETLFRVAQEALANVARHSRASRARVSLASDGKQAILTIADDGQGFDSRASSQGVGLRSMRERVEAAGGDLQIDSGTGGTTVVARVPITREGRT